MLNLANKRYANSKNTSFENGLNDELPKKKSKNKTINSARETLDTILNKNNQNDLIESKLLNNINNEELKQENPNSTNIHNFSLLNEIISVDNSINKI